MRKVFSLVMAAMLICVLQISLAEAKEIQSAEPVKESIVYPKDIDANLNYHGTVTIKAVIDKEGNVKSTEMMRASGRTKVDKVAMEAASRWKFKPALNEKGKPIENWYMIKFEAKDF